MNSKKLRPPEGLMMPVPNWKRYGWRPKKEDMVDWTLKREQELRLRFFAMEGLNSVVTKMGIKTKHEQHQQGQRPASPATSQMWKILTNYQDRVVLRNPSRTHLEFNHRDRWAFKIIMLWLLKKKTPPPDSYWRHAGRVMSRPPSQVEENVIRLITPSLRRQLTPKMKGFLYG